MPKYAIYLGYNIYFWSNENGEPVHVHISKGKPNGKGTEVWITSTGNALLCKNSSRIPKNELKLLLSFIESNSFAICMAWHNYFKSLTYYC